MSSRPTVLVVEDDSAIRAAVRDALAFHGYTVREAADGAAGLEAALADGVDLVLLDLLMPKLDGLSVLRELRAARPALPVIILTARGDEPERVRGLKSGADDYVVKPFGVQELLARVEAVLRRSAERPRATQPRVTIAGRSVDFERREVVFDGGEVHALSEREAQVLAYLALHRGRAVARDELLSRVWGVDPRGVHTRAVDMAVARLRDVLGDDPSSPRVIRTVRGRGYMLEGPESSQPAPGAAS